MNRQTLIDEVMPMMKQVGFTESEVRVYVALLSKTNSSPSEVAGISGITRNNVYDVLTSLERKGGCILVKSKKKLYEPVKPGILEMRARNKIEEDIQELETSMELAGKALENLYENSLSASDDVDYFRILRDPLVIADEIIHLVSQLESEYLVFSREIQIVNAMYNINQKLAVEMLEKSDLAMKEALYDRGVAYRSVSTLEGISDGQILDLVRNNYLELDNVDFRIVDKVPSKINIFDNNNLFIGLRSRRAAEYSFMTFHIKDEGLNEIFRDMFYVYFDKGVSIKELDIDVLLKEKRMKKK